MNKYKEVWAQAGVMQTTMAFKKDTYLASGHDYWHRLNDISIPLLFDNIQSWESRGVEVIFIGDLREAIAAVRLESVLALLEETANELRLADLPRCESLADALCPATGLQPHETSIYSLVWDIYNLLDSRFSPQVDKPFQDTYGTGP
jgi:hypothetical protein